MISKEMIELFILKYLRAFKLILNNSNNIYVFPVLVSIKIILSNWRATILTYHIDRRTNRECHREFFSPANQHFTKLKIKR